MKRFLVIFVILMSIATQAMAAGSDDYRLLTLTNQERPSDHALTLNEKVSNYALAHSIDMANHQGIFHTSTLKFRRVLKKAGVSWKYGGENVGTASAGWADPLQTIQDAFLKSDGHYANIVNQNFTHAGIGVYTAPNGSMWVTVVFYG